MTDDHMDLDVDALMVLALDEARAAVAHGDVPVGAVIAQTDTGSIVARRHNEREHLGDPTAHAEILALRDAAHAIGGWRLDTCMLVVTLEPCPMCAGAALQARIPLVVFGAADPKAGAAGSVLDVLGEERLNWRPEVAGGLLAAECAGLLSSFFGSRR